MSSSIKGEMIFAGDLTVNGEAMTGVAIQCEREALMGVPLPMYREVEVVEWISASEALPDDDMTVLIALDDGEVWTGFMDSVVWRYVSADAIEGTVTHWAEFPAPPGQ